VARNENGKRIGRKRGADRAGSAAVSQAVCDRAVGAQAAAPNSALSAENFPLERRTEIEAYLSKPEGDAFAFQEIADPL
jgi:hypothetical protein